MNDIFAWKHIAVCYLRFAYITAIEFMAFSKKLRTSRFMDSTIYSAACTKILIACIHDCVNMHASNIVSNNLDRHTRTSCQYKHAFDL